MNLIHLEDFLGRCPVADFVEKPTDPAYKIRLHLFLSELPEELRRIASQLHLRVASDPRLIPLIREIETRLRSSPDSPW